MTEKFNVTDGDRRQASSADHLVDSISIKDWGLVHPRSNTSSAATADHVSFDNSIYGTASAAGTDHGPLGTIAGSLQQDADTLKHSQKVRLNTTMLSNS